MLDEWVFMPMPKEIQRSTASLFVRPSSFASSWTLTFAATGGIDLSFTCVEFLARPTLQSALYSATSGAVPSNTAHTPVTITAPDATRSARSKALRCVANVRQAIELHSQAPRPGAVRLTSKGPWVDCTTRVSLVCALRCRHPMHVLTGPAASVVGCRLIVGLDHFGISVGR